MRSRAGQPRQLLGQLRGFVYDEVVAGQCQVRREQWERVAADAQQAVFRTGRFDDPGAW